MDDSCGCLGHGHERKDMNGVAWLSYTIAACLPLEDSICKRRALEQSMQAENDALRIIYLFS